MTRETITLTRREQNRAHVLVRVAHGGLRAREAALLLGLSLRHLRRLLARLRHRGLAALAHGHRGRPSPRRVPETIRAKVLAAARTLYAGCNDHHLTELLAEREGIHLSRVTVRRLLRHAGIGSPRMRRPPRHRRYRTCMPQAGLLVQLDGSHHPWLGDRGPHCVLLAAIDDATNQVLSALFHPREDAHGYFLLLHQMVRTHGLPVAVYTDRHGIFARDPRAPLSPEEQLMDRRAPTQIGRALQELGIHWIPASSPQAKGRIERLFGTFQDRLVQELRLAQAHTLTQANRILRSFLARYNARFAHPPVQPESAFRPALPTAALNAICCFKYRRIVAHDNTVRLDERLFQLLPGLGGRSYARAQVEIHERLDGSCAIYFRGQRLGSKALTRPPQGSTRATSADSEPHHARRTSIAAAQTNQSLSPAAPVHPSSRPSLAALGNAYHADI